MSITLNLKKGYDISIAGDPGKCPCNVKAVSTKQAAMTADDFRGLTLKPVVKEGDSVCTGQPLLRDKKQPLISVVSPISGTVKAINRGERRHLINVVIQSDGKETTFDASNGANIANDAKTLLMESGLWAMMRQRPYDIVPDPEATPRDIFVSAIDPFPLAGDRSEIFTANKHALEAGVKFLTPLTQGKVYISCRPGGCPDIAGAEMVNVVGPCPAGTPGIIAANISPVNKGETIWCLDAETLIRIGQLSTKGSPDWHTTVAVTGSETAAPHWVNVPVGAQVSDIIDIKKDNDNHKRVISGNPLTGLKIEPDGYLRYPYTQLTIIPEGDDTVEFMGWASLNPAKMSRSRSFLGNIFGRKNYTPDARVLGGKRAMIMSGEYESVIPMDILPEYLIKAILSRNIEQMEALGIYEVAPGDFAVAEHICSSKMPLQKIVAEGLDYLRKELQ